MPLRCTLEIGDRTVVESAGGPLETEYALFDPGNIELQQDGPGIIREVGYRTTVVEARRRLEALGVTVELANDAAAAMQPTLAQAYARGAAVRRVTQHLGAAELFDARSYEAGVRTYVGTWLDLTALAKDCKVLRATTALQAIFLAALLAESADSTRVFLSTFEYTRDRRPGERTYRRVQLEETAIAIPDALRALGPHAPPIDPNKPGPSRAELLELVNRRAATCGHAEARDRLATLARAIMAREPPPRGPLADSEVWALDTQLANGDATGVVERIDAIERLRGRLPATTYLRARAALLLGTEKPQVVAERVSALAQSMTAFFELELLAAEAWAKAGDPRRSKAFARDLVENPNAPDELRVRALELLEAKSTMDMAAVVPPSSMTTQAAAPAVPAPAPNRPPSMRAISRPASSVPPRPPRPDSRREAAAPEHEEEEEQAPDTAIEPAPIVAAGSDPPPPARDEPTMPDRVVGPISRPPPPNESDIPAAPKTPLLDPIARRMVSDPPPSPERIDIAAIPVDRVGPFPRPGGQTLASAESPPGVRGQSRPPFVTEAPPPMPPMSPPPMPRAIGANTEPAESLSLPPGLHGQPPPRDDLPRTPIDARIAFTYLSRELGREYRTRYKVELRTDVPSIEAMQRYLRERIPDPTNLSPEQLDDVRRHGAFLSEIIARQLGAYWVDLGPSELGYWAMLVPPHTRVWPFGRVLRFVHMGHKERDLVSYYLELESRARR